LKLVGGQIASRHELTLIPCGTGMFGIHTVAAYNPPTAGKWTLRLRARAY
jgi:hypothetical protein